MPNFESLLSSQEERARLNDHLIQTNEISKKDKKVIQDEVDLINKIVENHELMHFSAIFLNYLESDSEIDNQLILYLDRFVIKAEEFCSKNNFDCDAAFFNILMFACVYKKSGKSNDEIAELRRQMLLRQHLFGDSQKPDQDLSTFYGKVTKKILLMNNGFTSVAANLPKKTKDTIAQEGLACTFGFYNNVFASINNALKVEDNIEISDLEYDDVENFTNEFADSMLKGINKAIELNNPYITQVKLLMNTMTTVMWKLSSYMAKWLITNRKHSKQNDVDILLQKITDVFYDKNNELFDPLVKCKQVTALIEECLLKIKNSVTENGEVNVRNKTKLLSLTTDALNDLYLVEDNFKHFNQAKNDVEDDFVYSDSETHFFKKYSNVATIIKPRDMAEKSIFQVPIDKIRQARKESNAIFNNFFVKVADKLTFGLVALAISAFKGNPLLKEWSKPNNSILSKLPEPIKNAGGINEYLANLKPKFLKYKKQHNDETTFEFRILSAKKPPCSSDQESFSGLNEFGFLADHKKYFYENKKNQGVKEKPLTASDHYRLCKSNSGGYNEIANSCPFSIPIPILSY